MLLKNIKLKNFKRLRDFPVQFSPGINVIKGSLNETGKSTLLEGIVAALFYNPRSTARKLEDYISWGSNKRYQTSLEFEEEGNTYLLEKDFEKGTIRLVGYDTGEELDTLAEVSARLDELLGTKSDTLFSSTSCIRQDEVREVESGKREISDSLEKVITGGEENIVASQVIKRLGNKLSEIKKGLDRPAKFPGELKSLKSDIESVSRRHKEVEQELSEVEAGKIELVQIDKDLVQIKEEYERVRALLEKNKQRREIEASIKDLKQKYGEVDKLLSEIGMLAAKSKEATDALGAIEGFESERQVSETAERLNEVKIKHETIIGELPSRRKELADAESQISELKTKSEQAEQALKAIEGFETSQQVSEVRKKLDAIRVRREDTQENLTKRENEVAEAKRRLDKRWFVKRLSSRPFMVFAAIMSLAIVGLALLAVAMWTKKVLAQERTKISDLEERVQRMKEALAELDKEEYGVLAEVSCKTIGEFDSKEREFYHQLEESRTLGNQLSIVSAKSSDLQQRVQSMEAALAELDARKAGLLAEVKCTTLGEFETKEKHLHHWVQERDRCDNQLKGKLGPKTIEEIEQQRSEIVRNLRVTQDRLTEDLIATALSPEKYIELEGKVKNLERKQVEMDSRKRDCEAVTKRARFDTEDQILLEEELENLQEALEREEYRAKVYELAQEFISKARDEVLSSATEILEKEIQKHFVAFTNGKYDQVKAGEENLEFLVYSKEKTDWVKPEELSGGVIDEFYLACRLALVKLIFGEKKPPLILDDPFGNFDPVRLARTLEFFKKLGEEYQIIIFTLKDSYDEVASNVVVLD